MIAFRTIDSNDDPNCSVSSKLRNSTNIRNPLIYSVNRCFLIFGGSQVLNAIHAGMIALRTFDPVIIIFMGKIRFKRFVGPEPE